MKKLFITLSLFISTLSLFAQENPYKEGDTIENFKLNSALNEEFSLSSYSNTTGYIIAFINDKYESSNEYKEKLIGLHDYFLPRGIPLIVINPDQGGNGAKGIEKRTGKQAYDFPYLIDQKQKISKRFGVSDTPTAVIVERKHGKNILRYKTDLDTKSFSNIKSNINNVLNKRSVAMK